MPNPAALARQVRSALESAPDALHLDDLLAVVDDFVIECSASASHSDVSIPQLEEELHSLHHEVVDYTSLSQIEILLAVLYHLRPVLPPTSIVSWFDVVLRPALREPKLPTRAVNHAKELIVSALQNTLEDHVHKVQEFRRRLFDLWLLDAFNEASSDDVLEWAELQPEERAKRTRWKQNLRGTLRRFGNERPEDFLDEINVHFKTASNRRQLIDLFLNFMDVPNFPNVAKRLAHHPFMESLLHCLFFDNSSTLCTLALSLLSRVMPYLAAYAGGELRHFLPRFLAILVRIMLWKERPGLGDDPMAADIPVDYAFEQELESEMNRPLHISPKITWERLEMVFDRRINETPKSRSFFTMLYYLYPSNVLKFLRDPVQYLLDAGLESPYVESWEEVFTPTNEIRRNAENLLREHCSHPLLIWRDAVREVSEPEFWRKYNLTRIVSESHMLDIRNLAVAVRARTDEMATTAALTCKASPPVGEPDNSEPISSSSHPTSVPPPTPPVRTESTATESTVEPAERPQTPSSQVYIPKAREPETIPQPTFLKPLDLSDGRVSIRLQDMINISLALRSNLDVDVIPPTSRWSTRFPELISVKANEDAASTSAASSSSVSIPHSAELDLHVAQAITSLQRELLLLRNELNFELWLSRESAKHVGRLYQDRILMRTAETERQGLYNKLRKYRSQVNKLEDELREHRKQASTTKIKYVDWNNELQDKLNKLREEKRRWLQEAAALRSAEKETQALFVAQSKLLGEARQQVFDLETKWKENKHKIDLLRDYESQIDQHVKVQRLWNEDFKRFNERAEDMKIMQSQYQQIKIRLDSMEKTQAEAEEQCRLYRRQIQTLEAQQRRESSKMQPNTRLEEEMGRFAAEKKRLEGENARLRTVNAELEDQVEELRASVSVLGVGSDVSG